MLNKSMIENIRKEQKKTDTKILDTVSSFCKKNIHIKECQEIYFLIIQPGRKAKDKQ